MATVLNWGHSNHTDELISFLSQKGGCAGVFGLAQGFGCPKVSSKLISYEKSKFLDSGRSMVARLKTQKF